MANRREGLARIHIDAATAGLDLSKDRCSAQETALWEATNVCRSNRGTIVKRPDFVQYNTQIIEPTEPTKADRMEVVLKVGDEWEATTNVIANSYAAVNRGMVSLLARNQSTPYTNTVTRNLEPGEVYGTEWYCISFVIRAGNLVDSPNYLYLSVCPDGVHGTEYRFGTQGIYTKTGSSTFELLDGTDVVVDGNPHRVDIFVLTGGVAVRIDGVDITTTGATYFAMSHLIEFGATSGSALTQDGISAQFSSVILRDKAFSSFDGLHVPAISAVESFSVSSGTTLKHRLIAAGERYVFIDFEHSGMWRILLKKEYPNTSICQFRNTLIIINFSEYGNKTYVWRLYTDGTTEYLADAPNCKFGAEFMGRLFLGGDSVNPKRLYYSGDRNPRKWVVPESGQDYDLADLLDAGYFDIASDKSASVTGINNKFYGSLIVTTDDSVRAITGSSPADFGQRVVAADVGSAGPYSGCGGMNDFMCLNKNGITSIVSTDKYGDIAAERRSHPINSLFDVQNPTSNLVTMSWLQRAVLHYFSPMSIMVALLPVNGSRVANKMYTCQFPEMLWYGPFDVDATCMNTVIGAYPVADYLTIGTPDGKVKMMSFASPNTDQLKISTMYLDGRSLDPALVSMVKTWKFIRLTVNPTGNWPVTVRWKGDSGAWQQNAQNVLCGKSQALVGTATTGSAMAADRSEKHVIEIPLDVRSMSLKVEITSDAPKLSLTGIDVDFHISGYERE